MFEIRLKFPACHLESETWAQQVLATKAKLLGNIEMVLWLEELVGPAQVSGF